MKSQVKIIVFTALLSVMVWSCSKNDAVDTATLKQGLNQSALNLNNAVAAMSATKAFPILTVNDATTKSLGETTADYRVYITLDTVKGVWDYHPVPRKDRWGWSLMKYFNKSAESSKMIVNMPLSKVEHPWLLRRYVPGDSTLANNFSISVSDYHNNYNSYRDFDYLLNSDISIDSKAAGKLNIDYLVSPTSGIDYASEFAFTEKYTADYKYKSGDTTVSSFTLKDGSKVLYEEKLLTIKNDTARFGREKQYTLTIGDVSIVRKPLSHSVEVFFKGVLQQNAKVTVVDRESDPEASVCKKREVQITFDDGTTTTISALIGESVTDIKTIYDSLHQVYFAAAVVDWIAYDIYYKRN